MAMATARLAAGSARLLSITGEVSTHCGRRLGWEIFVWRGSRVSGVLTTSSQPEGLKPKSLLLALRHDCRALPDHADDSVSLWKSAAKTLRRGGSATARERVSFWED